MEITASAYLVQGFFFQERQLLGIGSMPGIGDAVVINDALCRDMFAGIIWREEGWHGWQGFLNDPVGPSTLSPVRLHQNLFEFEKQYHGRSDSIRYLFSIADGEDFWNGMYSGQLTGDGFATCVLTPLPEGMLQSPSI